MTVHEVTLKYGCPNCSPVEIDTGEFEKSEVQKRSLLRSVLWRLGLCASPLKTVLVSQPVKKRMYHSISIPLAKTRILTFHCPHCRGRGNYQLRVRKQSEHITWTIRYDDGSASIYHINHCPICGGRFTEYVLSRKYDDAAMCRGCSEQKILP